MRDGVAGQFGQLKHVDDSVFSQSGRQRRPPIPNFLASVLSLGHRCFLCATVCGAYRSRKAQDEPVRKAMRTNESDRLSVCPKKAGHTDSLSIALDFISV